MYCIKLGPSLVLSQIIEPDSWITKTQSRKIHFQQEGILNYFFFLYYLIIVNKSLKYII